MTHAMMVILWGLFFVLTMFISCSAEDTPTCRDADGKPVDWYYIYKLPRNKKSADPLQQQGLAYAYITSSAPQKGWTISTVGIDDQNSIPAKTLAPMYKAVGDDYIRVQYNDQTPTGEVSFTRGHAKGVLLSTETSGFWLVHSVPKYPPAAATKKYDYPVTGHRNGQSYLCITVPFREVSKIGTQLQYNQVFVYDSFIPTLLRNVTNIEAVIAGRDVETGKVSNVATISSLGNSSQDSSGVQFTSYAKTGKFGKDLYADLVATQEDVPLVVQSWRDGPGPLPSACERNPRTYNLHTTSLSWKTPDPKIEPQFLSTVDHSKWAVAWNNTELEPNKKVICVGDINRAEHQEIRGGGTVCQTHPDVWDSYFKSVKDYEKCPS